jgi:Tol biopolymer transport system component
MRRLLPLLALAAALVPAAPAGATLVFQRGDVRSDVWIADDDGSHARRLAPGRNPRIAPDGQTVLLGSRFSRKTPLLQAVPAGGGGPRTLLRDWQQGVFAWSPDSRTVAAVAGRGQRPQRLVLIDVATGTTRTVARGFFSAASFSPEGDRLVYGRTARDAQLFPDSDLWIAPVAGGDPTRLTTDGHGMYPVWGADQIAFARWHRPTGRDARMGGPQYDVWLVSADGSGRRRLTDDRLSYLLSGLVPTVWSIDGTRLVAQFGGQDTSYAVAIDPVSGRQHGLGPQAELGILASAISRDGALVLGATQSFGGPPRPKVVTVPWTGGRPSVLVRNATAPDWNA